MKKIVSIPPAKRLQAYKWVKKEIKEGATPFMCILLKNWVSENFKKHDYISSKELFKLFPEFKKQEPKSKVRYAETVWFKDDKEGNEKRIVVLDRCIKILKK